MKTFWGNETWLKASAFYLRYNVFVLEQEIEVKAEFDSLDDETRIYGVTFIENLPVATIRLQKDNETQLHPDRFCVAQKFRQQGIGKKLFLELEEKGQALGCHTSVLSAEVTATQFYEKLGYRIISVPFYEDGILCVTMEKNLLEATHDI